MSSEARTGSPPDGATSRAGVLIAAVFLLGIGVFGYGLATTVGVLPSGFGILGVLQFVLLLVGSLLVALTATAAVRLRRREHPRTVTTPQAVRSGLVAAATAFCVVVAAWWVREGRVLVPQFPEWILLGSVGLGLQFALGTVTPGRTRRRLLAGELVAVSLLLFTFLAVDRGRIQPVSYLTVSGGAAVLLFLFGYPLYLLGSELHGAPD
ncbi:hypothetical protein [Halobaculum sp. EA56]|uniref:hypothetical protein n=1 Tax=Halobaculum sp. EA56 TaxID=3421648 RepID=UPI003EBF40F0